ncbi:uncharacterized protein BN572_02135 [Clostridium sp. CAG:264]|nr:uncharacterized protein BN572_02135 [Clostridium sp. CAG:264]
MVKDDLVEEQDWKGNLDILNIVMIGLAKEIPPKEEKYELHRLLGTLLSQTMTAEQKLKLMKQEYDIPVDRNGIRDEVKIMCNLSEGVEEMGYAKGEAAGKTVGRAEGEIIGEARGKSEIILKMQYDIPVDRNGIRDEVKVMCNLSEGVEEMGYVKGEAAGIAKGEIIGEARGKSEIILKMYKKGYSLEQIMDVTDMSEAEIKEIIG